MPPAIRLPAWWRPWQCSGIDDKWYWLYKSPNLDIEGNGEMNKKVVSNQFFQFQWVSLSLPLTLTLVKLHILNQKHFVKQTKKVSQNNIDLDNEYQFFFYYIHILLSSVPIILNLWPLKKITFTKNVHWLWCLWQVSKLTFDAKMCPNIITEFFVYQLLQLLYKVLQ